MDEKMKAQMKEALEQAFHCLVPASKKLREIGFWTTEPYALGEVRKALEALAADPAAPLEDELAKTQKALDASRVDLGAEIERAEIAEAMLNEVKRILAGLPPAATPDRKLQKRIDEQQHLLTRALNRLLGKQEPGITNDIADMLEQVNNEKLQHDKKPAPPLVL